MIVGRPYDCICVQVACTGGGSNFGGLAFPILREKMAGKVGAQPKGFLQGTVICNAAAWRASCSPTSSHSRQRFTALSGGSGRRAPVHMCSFCTE